jgi:hypothetical protein
MLKNIPKERAFIYLLVGGLLPLVIVWMSYLSKQNSVQEVHAAVKEMQHRAAIREKKQAINMAVRNHYAEADHFYIDKHLETVTFLEPEIESLQKLLGNKNLADDEAIKRRLEMLSGQGNALTFSEGVVTATPAFQETTETLIHPVEINNKDLQKILARIEGIQIGEFAPSPSRPQLIVLDFKLDRRAVTEKNEIFVLNLKLLKREYP